MSVSQVSAKHSAPAPGGRLRKIEAPEPASQLDDFVYIVSHDIRNSIRALTEVPQWLRDDLLDLGVTFNDDLNDNFDLLKEHSERLDRMLMELLVYSRIGRLQETAEVDLAELVQTILAENAKTDRIFVSVSGDPTTMIIGYKDAYVLLKSIIDNVVDHCPGPDARLDLSIRRAGDEVHLTCTDNGPGIAPNDLPRAFQPMTRLNSRGSNGRCGMGLNILQRVVAHYRGELWMGDAPEPPGLAIKVKLKDAVD